MNMSTSYARSAEKAVQLWRQMENVLIRVGVVGEGGLDCTHSYGADKAIIRRAGDDRDGQSRTWVQKQWSGCVLSVVRGTQGWYGRTFSQRRWQGHDARQLVTASHNTKIRAATPFVHGINFFTVHFLKRTCHLQTSCDFPSYRSSQCFTDVIRADLSSLSAFNTIISSFKQPCFWIFSLLVRMPLEIIVDF